MKFLTLLLCLGLCATARAQSLVDDANLTMAADGASAGSFAETIKIISGSKKIFILTNNNQQLGPGDFISLALEDKLAARAVVAKVHQGQVGIKILKIYSVAQWGRLRRDLEVQVIKGDDSTFGKKPEPKAEDSTAKIKSEEDLYTGDVVADDDLGIVDENKNRHIKPDNVVSIFGSQKSADEVASRGGSLKAPTFGFSWAYQFTDNYFIEGLYGRTLFDNYPDDGSQTLLNTVVARIKYNVKGPAFTFFMPYLGYQSNTVSSPDAGTTGVVSTDNEQLDAIDKLKKSGPVFGVTVLRRLVPGWFVKADVGTDIIDLGFSIEF